jgi:hypothetical protein
LLLEAASAHRNNNRKAHKECKVGKEELPLRNFAISSAVFAVNSALRKTKWLPKIFNPVP